MFIAYIYIHFNQNVEEKSDISAKFEAGKHLQAVFFLLAAESSMSNQIVESHGLF